MDSRIANFALNKSSGITLNEIACMMHANVDYNTLHTAFNIHQGARATVTQVAAKGYDETKQGGHLLRNTVALGLDEARDHVLENIDEPGIFSLLTSLIPKSLIKSTNSMFQAASEYMLHTTIVQRTVLEQAQAQGTELSFFKEYIDYHDQAESYKEQLKKFVTDLEYEIDVFKRALSMLKANGSADMAFDQIKIDKLIGLLSSVLNKDLKSSLKRLGSLEGVVNLEERGDKDLLYRMEQELRYTLKKMQPELEMIQTLHPDPQAFTRFIERYEKELLPAGIKIPTVEALPSNIKIPASSLVAVNQKLSSIEAMKQEKDVRRNVNERELKVKHDLN